MMKNEILHPKIEARMSPITTPIQHHTESFSQCNVTKKYTDWVGRNKTMFADAMTMYVEHLKELTKKKNLL